MDDNYSIFQERLNEFIKKYYVNQFIKGIVFFTICILLIVLTSSVIEYIAWTSKSFRLFLFVASIVGIAFVFYYFLLIPILRYFKILPKITYKHAIHIISKHFPESKDVIINIYELSLLNDENSNSNLLSASIEQKIKISEKFDFKSAVTKSSYYPFFKYLLSLVIVYFFILLFKPDVLISGSSRIINYKKDFQKEVSFTINIDSSDLVVEKGKNKEIGISVLGDNIPEYLNIEINGHEFILHKVSNNYYTYEFKNVVNEFAFRLVNAYYTSEYFKFNVIVPPSISNFVISVNYPKYLELNNIEIDDKLTFKVPFGSEVEWKFNVSNVDTLKIITDSSINYCKRNGDSFQFKHKICNDFTYSVIGINKNINKVIYVENTISVIPDLFPSIIVTEFTDSSNLNLVFYKGFIEDDYGFSKLEFVVNDGNNDTICKIPINKNSNSQAFVYAFDYNSVSGNIFSSYFEIFDNDEISGFKSTKSNIVQFKKYEKQELKLLSERKQELLEKNFEKSWHLANELVKESKDIKKRLLSENLTDFEKKQLIENLVDKQKQLVNLVDNIKNENLKKSSIDNQFQNNEQEIIKKAEMIKELLNSLLTDEIMNLFKELEKLKNAFNQEKFNELSKELERNTQELSEQLDKDLELLKRFDIEKQVLDIIDDLKSLSKNQELLASDLQEKKSIDSIKQENLNNEKLAEKVLNEYNKALEKNEKLDEPMDLNSFNQELENLDNDVKNSIEPENTKEKNIKKLQKNSKTASDLADALQETVDKNFNDKEGEDAAIIRQILENLLFFSFKQEDIEKQFSNLTIDNPKYNEILFDQNSLVENFEIIKDSLYEVSKRNPNLGAHISSKAFDIENRLLQIKDLNFEENNSDINLRQRYVIEYSNDLVLLLSESLKNMENSNSIGSGTSKKKNKMKPGKPSTSDMRKSQESMKSQLEEMVKQLKNGGLKGGNKQSEKLAKMLAQQEVFQQMINEISGSSGVGKEFAKQLNEISKLVDENKRDISRYQITQQTVNRQQKIVTRLLEAEKAEQEREFDNKRISNEAVNYINNDSKVKFEDSLQITNFEELFSKSSIHLRYFYKNKYQDYINRLNQVPDEKGDKNSIEN